MHKADSLAQIAERIALDFSLSEEQIIFRLNKSIGNFSPEDKATWEKVIGSNCVSLMEKRDISKGPLQTSSY